MLDYTKLKAWEGVDPWPPFDDLPFITTTEGNPQHSGRFDQGGFGARTMVGVWECTPGKFEYTYPGDEICTLLIGFGVACEECNDGQPYCVGILADQMVAGEKGGEPLSCIDEAYCHPMCEENTCEDSTVGECE